MFAIFAKKLHKFVNTNKKKKKDYFRRALLHNVHAY